MSDLEFALKQLAAARPEYDEAESFYNGTADEIFVSKLLRRVLGPNSGHFRVNYARVPVRSRLTRLEINAVTGGDAAQTEILERAWERNIMGQETHDVHEAALEFGNCYAIAWPGPDYEADPEDIEIFFNSPKSVRLFYSAENPRKKSFAVKAWVEGGKSRVDLYYADRIEPYISRQEVGSGATNVDYEPFIEDEDGEWPLENPFGEIPVFHFRTQRMYGRPEHKDAYGPQNAVNKLVATQMSSVDFNGFPQRWALEDPTFAGDGNDVDAAFGDTETTDDDDPTSDLQSGPGELWWLKGVKQVGQFSTAEPDAFLDPMREYVNAMATVTDTPLHAFKVDGQMPSGESRRAAEAPLNKRVEDLQLVFGATWKELYRFVLKMAGVQKPIVNIAWKEPQSYDDLDVWETAKVQKEVGVPLRQIMLERGYTTTQLDEWGITDEEPHVITV